MSSPHCVSLVDQIDNLLLRRDEMLSQALNLDLLVLVFEDLQDLVIVEQVVNFTPIDLVHGNCHGEVPLVVLPVIDSPLEQVLHGEVLQTLHSESLTRACLAVGEDCDRTGVEDEVENWVHAESVQLLI